MPTVVSPPPATTGCKSSASCAGTTAAGNVADHRREGQGNGERIDKKGDIGEEEVQYDALGNPIAAAKKAKKISAADKRKAKKDRMAKRKAGIEVFTDDEEF